MRWGLLILIVCSAAAMAGGMQQPRLYPPDIQWPVLPEGEMARQTVVTDDMAERSRRWLVRHLDSISDGIDTFFVDKFFNEDVTDIDSVGSQARFSFFTRRELGKPVDYKFGVGINIELPHTNERLNLLLQSEDEDVRESDPFESPENATYSSALRFIINESERWIATADAGIRWGIPPDPFVRFRARRPFYFDYWNFRISQEFNYYTTDGYGSETGFRFDLPLSIRKLLRLETDAEYLLNNDYFKLTYGGGLYHEINHIYAYALLAQARGDTEAGIEFREYEAGVRLRRRVYKDWMFAEVQPMYVWTEENDWEPRPVIMFLIQAEFYQ